MEITIDIDNPTPLFSQLIDQIKAAVLDGHLSPGQALPSIRQLAGDLDLNAKTVAKAYRFLERDSVIETKGYRGTFIHPEARANSRIDRSASALSRLSRVITSLRDEGVPDSEIRKAFQKVMSHRHE